jgi:hypothetical protein
VVNNWPGLALSSVKKACNIALHSHQALVPRLLKLLGTLPQTAHITEVSLS